ncbi:MAG: hypothetical protein H6732_00830 [Alphaproteobacteria bacterium]|nr:hypothetical protein [Alphaproteobacteria bacterium]
MRALRDHELLVVTGKGGVGRTTTTAALGLAAAREGLRTCVVELGGQASLARTLGLPDAAYGPREVAPGLHLMSLSATACLGDFGQRKLHVGALARWFFESRVMAGFVEAVPGLTDVVQLGKVEDMLAAPQRDDPVFDLVVLDAPATGHGLTLLAAARAMAEMTAVGPFHDLAAIIEGLLGDPERTGVVLVTLPEALPVQESVELAHALATDGAPPVLTVVNQRLPPWPDGLDEAAVTAALTAGAGPDEPAPPLLADLARSELRRHRAQVEALAQLARRLPEVVGHPVPLASLARLADPGRLDDLLPPLRAHLGAP